MDIPLEGWVSIREDQLGKNYVEAVMRSRPFPDGSQTEEVSHFNLEYRLLPERGQYSMAIFHVSVTPYESRPAGSSDIGEEKATIVAVGEFVGYGGEYLLYDATDEQQIGSVDLEQSLMDEFCPDEGDTCYLVIEIEYRDEFTKSEHGYSEERNQKSREETEQDIERRLDEYY